MEALPARRVSSSPDILKPGDYCFIAKREPIRTYETVTAEPPTGFWKRLFWTLGFYGNALSMFFAIGSFTISQPAFAISNMASWNEASALFKVALSARRERSA